jgi:hypothetical protein
MGDIVGLYRRIPVVPALALATVGATTVAFGITIAAVLTISRVLDRYDQSGPGAGVLVVTAVPNILLPSFIIALTLLVNLHGQASWKTPTAAFLIGAIATWKWVGPFGITFAPVVLGVAMVAWGVSCFMLYRKANTKLIS